MRCQTAQSYASLDLDRRLGADLHRELKAHLDGCLPCRTSQEAMGAAWDALGSTRSLAAPDDFREIVARLHRRPRLLGWLEGLWVASPGRLASAAALSAFLVLGVAAGAWMSRALGPSLPIEALAISEAFGEAPGALWLTSEGSINP